MKKRIKKVLAKEILIFIGVIVFTLVLYLIINFVEDGNFNYLHFNIWSDNPFRVINTYLLAAAIIIAYIIRPIVLVIKWALKTVNEG